MKVIILALGLGALAGAGWLAHQLWGPVQERRLPHTWRPVPDDRTNFDLTD